MDASEPILRREMTEMLVWVIVGPIIIVLYCAFLVFRNARFFRNQSIRCIQWWDAAVLFGVLAFMVAIVVLCGQRYADLKRVMQQPESMAEYYDVHYTKNARDKLSAAVARFWNARRSLGTNMYLYEQRGVKPPGMKLEPGDECEGSNSAHVATHARVLANFKTHLQAMMDSVTDVQQVTQTRQEDYVRWRAYKVMLVLLGVSGAAMIMAYQFPQNATVDDSIKRYFASYILFAAIVGGSVGSLLTMPDVDEVGVLLKDAMANIDAMGAGQFDPSNMDYRMFKQHVRQAGKRMTQHSGHLAALYPGVPSKAARKRIALTGMILSAVFILFLALGLLVKSHTTFAMGLLCLVIMIILALSVGL